MLIDDVTITVTAGSGGDGLVSFNKNKMSLGPTGGDGGSGGDVYFKGVSNIGALSQFRGIKTFSADNGRRGGGQRKTGYDGDDLILSIPIGTVIHNLDNNKDFEINHIGETLLVASGGQGGRGNFFFRSSRNTTPKRATKGEKGDQFRFRLELKLIADIGLVGFPNAGKSTLLNTLTESQSKVANYPFTTLEPHLGVYYELIIADIPGLIEGASVGKGLGTKFLRHIERTNILFHLISAESANPKKDYQTIRIELGKYNKKLLKKEEYVFLSKCDNVDQPSLRKKIGILRKLNPRCYPLSILDDKTVANLRKILNKIKTEKVDEKQQ